MAAASAACGLSLLLVWLPVLARDAAALAASAAPVASESGDYRLRYRSRLEPLAINRIHTWELHLETASGEPVSGAAFTVSGGMPAHDHGLATEPRITERGDGDYLLEGLRFHMNGYWELVLALRVDGRRDRIVVPLEL